MSRVAIYLADPAPIGRDGLCAAFETAQTAGDRVVTLVQDMPDASTLPALISRLGGEFDRLLMVSGDDLYEVRPAFKEPSIMSADAIQ